MYEELTFVPGLLKAYRPEDIDVTLTCSYPYTSWVLRARKRDGRRPVHVFVTENSDWALKGSYFESRWFFCDGLVCTNIEYFEHHRERWKCSLIPNGVDIQLFSPGMVESGDIGVSAKLPFVLIVSALTADKRVMEGIEALAPLKDVAVVVAGNGPLERDVDKLGKEKLGERFQRLVLPHEAMPDLYRAAAVHLHMSRDEPFGNIYLEALATGLPVVAHDNERTRWIMEDQGFLVDTANPQAIRDAVGRALEHRSPEDVVRRRALIARRFSWPKVARAYFEFFSAVHKEALLFGEKPH
jgi:glycosyltransferase involved in cell wall biosynthesis